MKSKLAVALVSLMSLTLLASCAISAGSQTVVMRENQLGTAVVPMEEVKVKAYRADDSGVTTVQEVTIKIHTVIRIGVTYLARRNDQIQTVEKVTFKAMVPDDKGVLIPSTLTVDEGTGIKIGTTVWVPPAEKTSEQSTPTH